MSIFLFQYFLQRFETTRSTLHHFIMAMSCFPLPSKIAKTAHGLSAKDTDLRRMCIKHMENVEEKANGVENAHIVGPWHFCNHYHDIVKEPYCNPDFPYHIRWCTADNASAILYDPELFKKIYFCQYQDPDETGQPQVLLIRLRGHYTRINMQFWVPKSVTQIVVKRSGKKYHTVFAARFPIRKIHVLGTSRQNRDLSQEDGFSTPYVPSDEEENDGKQEEEQDDPNDPDSPEQQKKDPEVAAYLKAYHQQRRSMQTPSSQHFIASDDGLPNDGNEQPNKRKRTTFALDPTPSTTFSTKALRHRLSSQQRNTEFIEERPTLDSQKLQKAHEPAPAAAAAEAGPSGLQKPIAAMPFPPLPMPHITSTSESSGSERPPSKLRLTNDLKRQSIQLDKLKRQSIQLEKRLKKNEAYHQWRSELLNRSQTAPRFSKENFLKSNPNIFQTVADIHQEDADDVDPFFLQQVARYGQRQNFVNAMEQSVSSPTESGISYQSSHRFPSSTSQRTLPHRSTAYSSGEESSLDATFPAPPPAQLERGLIHRSRYDNKQNISDSSSSGIKDKSGSSNEPASSGTDGERNQSAEISSSPNTTSSHPSSTSHQQNTTRNISTESDSFGRHHMSDSKHMVSSTEFNKDELPSRGSFAVNHPENRKFVTAMEEADQEEQDADTAFQTAEEDFSFHRSPYMLRSYKDYESRFSNPLDTSGVFMHTRSRSNAGEEEQPSCSNVGQNKTFHVTKPDPNVQRPDAAHGSLQKQIEFHQKQLQLLQQHRQQEEGANNPLNQNPFLDSRSSR